MIPVVVEVWKLEGRLWHVAWQQLHTIFIHVWHFLVCISFPSWLSAIPSSFVKPPKPFHCISFVFYFCTHTDSHVYRKKLRRTNRFLPCSLLMHFHHSFTVTALSTHVFTFTGLTNLCHQKCSVVKKSVEAKRISGNLWKKSSLPRMCLIAVLCVTDFCYIVGPCCRNCFATQTFFCVLSLLLLSTQPASAWIREETMMVHVYHVCTCTWSWYIDLLT